MPVAAALVLTTRTSAMQLVIGEIGPGAATALQAVKLLAAYLSGDAGNRVGSMSLQSSVFYSFHYHIVSEKLCISTFGPES